MSGSCVQRLTTPRPLSINIAQYCPDSANQRAGNKVKGQRSASKFLTNQKADSEGQGQRSLRSSKVTSDRDAGLKSHPKQRCKKVQNIDPVCLKGGEVSSTPKITETSRQRAADLERLSKPHELGRAASVKVTKVVSQFRTMTQKTLYRNKSVMEPSSRRLDNIPGLMKRRSLSETDGDAADPSLQALVSTPGALIQMYDREEEDKQLRKMIEELSLEYELRKKKEEMEKEEQKKKEMKELEVTHEETKDQDIEKTPDEPGSQNIVREKTGLKRTSKTVVRKELEKNDPDLDSDSDDNGARQPKQSFFSLLKRLPNQILPGRKSLKKKNSDTAKKSFSNVNYQPCATKESTKPEKEISRRQRKYSADTEEEKYCGDIVHESMGDDNLKDAASCIEVQPYRSKRYTGGHVTTTGDEQTANTEWDADDDNAEVFTSSSEGSVTSLELLDLRDPSSKQHRVRDLGLSQCSLASTAFTDLSQLTDAGCYSDSELCIDDESEMNLAKQEVLASNIRRPLSLDRATFNTNLIPIAEDF